MFKFDKPDDSGMRFAAISNLASAGITLAVAAVTGKIFSTGLVDACESLTDTAVHLSNLGGHNHSLKQALKVNIAATTFGLISELAYENGGSPSPYSLFGSVASAGVSATNVHKLKSTDPEPHHQISIIHARSDLAGSSVALFANLVSLKYGVADTIGILTHFIVRTTSSVYELKKSKIIDQKNGHDCHDNDHAHHSH